MKHRIHEALSHATHGLRNFRGGHVVRVVVLMGWILSLGVASVNAQDLEQGDGGIRSRLVWRGIRLIDGPAATGSISFRAAGFRFNTWGAVDLKKGRAQEMDLSLEYPALVGNWGSLMAGFTWTVSRTRSDTGEAYLAVNPVLQRPVVDLSLEARVDVRSGKGAWVAATVGRSIRRLSLENVRCVRVEAILGASIAHAYLGKTTDMHTVKGPFSGEVQISMTQLISQRFGRWSLEPVVAVAFPLSGSGRNVLQKRNGGRSVTPWFGISLTGRNKHL